jgi:hypothetical protein
MNTYIFTVDTEEGFRIVVIFADGLAQAANRLLDFDMCKECDILGVVIKAA